MFIVLALSLIIAMGDVFFNYYSVTTKFGIVNRDCVQQCPQTVNINVWKTLMITLRGVKSCSWCNKHLCNVLASKSFHFFLNPNICFNLQLKRDSFNIIFIPVWEKLATNYCVLLFWEDFLPTWKTQPLICALLGKLKCVFFAHL